MKKVFSFFLLPFALFLLAGCTSRGITVTSLPEGAEVSINHRVVGKTPIRVGFTHYGTYRIELRKEKYDVLVREEPVRPPWYGYDPPAFVADNLVPARLDDEVYLHYVMRPQEEKADKAALRERDALLSRAELAREGKVTNPRTGEQLEVALYRPAKKPTEVAMVEEEPGTDLRTKPVILEPAGLKPVIQDIVTLPPEGAKLAKEFGIEAPKEKPKEKTAASAFLSPEEAEKPAASRVIRTPKDEQFIFETPAVPEPAQRPAKVVVPPPAPEKKAAK